MVAYYTIQHRVIPYSLPNGQLLLGSIHFVNTYGIPSIQDSLRSKIEFWICGKALDYLQSCQKVPS